MLFRSKKPQKVLVTKPSLKGRERYPGIPKGQCAICLGPLSANDRAHGRRTHRKCYIQQSGKPAKWFCRCGAFISLPRRAKGVTVCQVCEREGRA